MFLLEHFPGINSLLPLLFGRQRFFQEALGEKLTFLWLHRLENWKSQDTIQEERVDILRLEDEVDAVVGFL